MMKQMRWRMALLPCTIALHTLLVSCSTPASEPVNKDGTEEAPAAAPVEAEALDYGAAFDLAKDDKLVSLEGYGQLPGMMYTSGNSARIDFYARPLQRFGNSISVSIGTGDCNNCMASLGESYSLDDLRIKDDQGNEIRANERMRVTGILRVSKSLSDETGVTVSIAGLRKIERLDPVAYDYSKLEVLELTAETVKDTTHPYELYMAKGRLTIPSMLFMENDVSLDMKVGGTSVFINFLFGNGPNQIESIPSNYSNKDFKIHDYKGDLIDLNKPVKVWGNRSKPERGYGGTLYVERVEQ